MGRDDESRRRLVVSFDDEPHGAAEPGPAHAPAPSAPRAPELPSAAPVPASAAPAPDDDLGIELRRPAPAPAIPAPHAPPTPTPTPAAPLAPHAHTNVAGIEYASWSRRVAAYLIDAIVVGVLIMVAFALFGAIGATVGGSSGFVMAFFIVWLLALIPQILYSPVLMARQGARNGQTLGKQALEIRVVREDGRPMDFGAGMLRDIVVRGFVFGGLGMLLLWIPLLLDYLWPLWDERRRCLHDIVCKTAVVRST